ncbi:SH3 domain-containing kinase-binding protein 1-like isoform X4 [Penaeus indicus]|uniref:SH3 domain-containing kinase-binding protein 1-like isoform X4 n=1 Tax=Penaeus indicus TaxID=29960 RepID=UPI00300D0B06
MFLVCCSGRQKRYSFTPSYSFCHQRASVYQVLSKEPKNGSTDTNLTTTTNVQKRDNPSSPLAEMSGRRCRVVFSYAPQHDDELPLCVGQTIEVLQEVEEGWWKGVLDGQVGMFPSNFVESLEESEGDSKQPESSSLENINNQLNINGEEKEIKPKPIQGMGYGVKLTDLKKDAGTKKDTEGPTSNGSPKILGSSGSSAFQPVSKNKEPPKENGQVKDFRDLPHRLPPALEPKGDKITSKVDKTRINSADKERINSIEKDRITITIGEEKSKGETASRRDDRLPLPSTSPPQVSPPQLPPKPVRELARVMFPYTAEHEDELELKEGDIIIILCKELEDKGWWRGELNGQVGVFPDNFVELISPEETAKPPRPEKPSTVIGKKGSPASSTDTTPTGTLNKADKEPPPPLPEKKVQPPPPPEKKPLPHPSLHASDTHDGSCSSKDSSDLVMSKGSKKKSEVREDLSLTLDTNGEPLKHVTHLRPKGPSRRRPPSGVFKENMKNSADSDTHLPPTPEDDLDNDSSHQLNGHVSNSELPRSPSVPTISPTPQKPTMRSDVPPPQADSGSSVPWLQELHLKQKKRLSGIIVDGEASAVPPPVISPKPAVLPHKMEDKPKPPRPSLPMSEAINSSVKRPVEPRLPTPDYDSKAPITKSKPLPQTPLTSVQPEKRLGLVADQRSSVPASEAKKTGKEIKKGHTAPSAAEAPSNLEEKIDALYKDLIPKIKLIEERMEEQKKEHSRKMQMLMSDLDEERKKRACMEVEIERLKKLINAYAQV